MVRADVYLTNLSKVDIAVGMTNIKPNETKKILHKDFERKASYIDRMIKEGVLSLGSSSEDGKVEAPSSSETEATGVTPPVDDVKDENVADANNEDASEEAAEDVAEETAAEENTEEVEAEATEEAVEEKTEEKEEVEKEEVPAPKTRGRRKK